MESLIKKERGIMVERPKLHRKASAAAKKAIRRSSIKAAAVVASSIR